MRTFSIQTLGCKVNHYESEQIADFLLARGWKRVDPSIGADLRVINTCSVTLEAASKSRQTVRRVVRLPVLGHQLPVPLPPIEPTARVLVTGCWATSDPQQAARLPGVSAVLTHHENIADKLDTLLTQWISQPQASDASQPLEISGVSSRSRGEQQNPEAGNPAGEPNACNPIITADRVKNKITNPGTGQSKGMVSLPLLDRRQASHQRALLKIQEGCDAHCTYCIIPQLRPNLWSKPIEHTVAEARALVEAGHRELVLTGIFLGAYGQPTALRRRQPQQTATPLGQLLRALCDEVPGLRRVRLSSLEPGDLSAELLALMRDLPQVVPHFHLPLQSGSDAILRRMNRQYRRDDFLRMVDQVREAFDRPAITTDIIAGFPGETDAEFAQTLDVVERAGFIHIHAFPFSPRPGTAAARWGGEFVRGPAVNERIRTLRERAAAFDHHFRRQFIGQTVGVLVERNAFERAGPAVADASLRHGRCERYFAVHFEGDPSLVGRLVRVRIDSVTSTRTLGTLIDAEEP